MTSESKSESSEGRGLPVGWGWRPPTTDTHAWLGRDDDKPEDAIAVARSSGHWTVFRDRSTRIIAEGHAKPCDGEDATNVAQREAEAALWRVDGFGVGEVRGYLFTSHARPDLETSMASGAPIHLACLAGVWRVTAVRPVDGGVEVDAMRLPVAPEHADGCAYYFADAADAESLCNCRGTSPHVTVEPGKPLPVSFSGLRAAGYEVAEPAPLPLAAMTGCDSHSVTPRAGCAECNAIAEREDPTFTTGCPDHPRIWDRACATCEALLCGNAPEPAPREPPAPTALPAHYDDEERRAWIAEALGIPSRLVFLGWSGGLGWALNTITIKRDDVPGVLPEGIRADEIATLAAAGIVATAKGWTFAKEQGR